VISLLTFTSTSNNNVFSSAFPYTIDNNKGFSYCQSLAPAIQKLGSISCNNNSSFATPNTFHQLESFRLIAQTTTTTNTTTSVLTPTQIYNRVGNSVVYIQAYTQNGVFSGSGFFFDSAGHVVTNRHVVFDAVNVFVTLSNGNRYAARIIGLDFYSDLAVLSIDRTAVIKEKIIPIELGTSDNLSVGEQVFSIGSPLGIEGTMTQGIISRLRYFIPLYSSHGSFDPTNPYHEVIVFDAPATHGNSGGVLLNQYAQLIGVTEGGLQGVSLNFAIPVYIINNVVPVLIQNGIYKYADLGIHSGSDMSRYIADYLHLHNASGCVVGSVNRGGPAAIAGIQGGTDSKRIPNTSVNSDADVIIRLDTQPILSCTSLRDTIRTGYNIGDRVSLTLVKNNIVRDVTVTLGYQWEK
jgi:S1-C subfamily serine protease